MREPSSQRASSSLQNIHIVLVAWGSQDVQISCRLTLPSLMSPRNLPALGLPTTTTICCLSDDRQLFERSENFEAFSQGVTVDWHFMNEEIAAGGESREVVVADTFRRAMSNGHAATSAHVLIKPGTVLADGGLSFVADSFRAGARAVLVPYVFGSIPKLLELASQGERPSFAPRDVVRSCCEDPSVFTSSFCGLEKPWGFPASDRLAIAHEEGHQTLATARWHPLALRPHNSVTPRRQSLLDAEIVPEFVADEADVRWAATSDEALLIDVRSEDWLARRFDVESLSAREVVQRIEGWATPWQLRGFSQRYHLTSCELDDSAKRRDPFEHLPVPAAKGRPAARHPLWLTARGLQQLAPELGSQRRYQSVLDHYYRVTRLAIEAARADEVVYAGFASHVFAPFLARSFECAYLTDLDYAMAKGLAGDPAKTSLFIAHIDLHRFKSSFLFGDYKTNLIALLDSGLTVLLLVESPDSQGGLENIDRNQWQTWYELLLREAKTTGADCAITSTIINFFHGHPGLLISLRPNERTKRPPPRPSPKGRDGAAQQGREDTRR